MNCAAEVRAAYESFWGPTYTVVASDAVAQLQRAGGRLLQQLHEVARRVEGRPPLHTLTVSAAHLL